MPASEIEIKPSQACIITQRDAALAEDLELGRSVADCSGETLRIVEIGAVRCWLSCIADR